MNNVTTRLPMPNGVRVGDWLGTAATSAEVAANHLHAARTAAEAVETAYQLDTAILYLEQALEEAHAVVSATRA